jgi:hypothetical protein
MQRAYEKIHLLRSTNMAGVRNFDDVCLKRSCDEIHIVEFVH